MTPYEQARVLLGIAGVLVVILGAIIAYVVCVERRLSRDDVRIAELYVYLKNNIPDMIAEVLSIRCELARIVAHLELPPARDAKTSEYRRARLAEAKQSITEMLETRGLAPSKRGAPK